MRKRQLSDQGSTAVLLCAEAKWINGGLWREAIFGGRNAFENGSFDGKCLSEFINVREYGLVALRQLQVKAHDLVGFGNNLMKQNWLW